MTNNDPIDPLTELLQDTRQMLHDQAVAIGYAYELLNSLLIGTIKLDRKGRAVIRDAMARLNAPFREARRD